MAEGILRSIAARENRNIAVRSAGINVFSRDKASKHAIEAMKNMGVDILNHQSMQIDESMVEEADLILTMAASHKDYLLSTYPEHRDKIFTLLDYAYGVEKDLADPYGKSLYVYEHTRDAIQQAILQIIKSHNL